MSQVNCKAQSLSALRILRENRAVKQHQTGCTDTRRAFFTRNGAMQLLTPDDLKTTRFSVLLSNPPTKDEFNSVE
jgi:hypothetical protein